MKNRPFVPTLAAALALAVCTLAPLAATDKDDKKPLPQAPTLNDEYRLGPGDNCCAMATTCSGGMRRTKN